MVLLKLSVVSLGHSETDPKIKRSAYAAQMLLASYRDELVGYFQLRSQQRGWHYTTVGSTRHLQMRPRGERRRAGHGPGLALGLGQLSEVVPPGRQMDDYVSLSCVPTAQSAAPEESTSWALNHPESSGFCRCRSHQWNQNLLFQMERQTMHNMSRCTLCDRLVPATNEAAGAHHRYRTVVSAVILESKGL